jgi:hypothetical protein
VESEISIGALPPLLRYPILMALVYRLNRTAKSQVRHPLHELQMTNV